VNTILEKIHKDHQLKPFISPERDLDAWLLNPKPVPKRNMELLTDDLLAGDIILLWRIQFGTFTTETWFPKYFEYTYGIDAPKQATFWLTFSKTTLSLIFEIPFLLGYNGRNEFLKGSE